MEMGMKEALSISLFPQRRSFLQISVSKLHAKALLSQWPEQKAAPSRPKAAPSGGREQPRAAESIVYSLNRRSDGSLHPFTRSLLRLPNKNTPIHN